MGKYKWVLLEVHDCTKGEEVLMVDNGREERLGWCVSLDFTWCLLHFSGAPLMKPPSLAKCEVDTQPESVWPALKYKLNHKGVDRNMIH